MSLEFLCQACGARLRIDDDLAGKPVKCPQCSGVVPATAAGETASESPFAGAGPAPPASDDMNPYASPTGTSGGRNPEIVAAGEKMSKNYHAIDTGGPQRVIITTLRASIGFRLNPYGKGRLLS